MGNNNYRWGMNPTGAYQKVILPWHRPETPQQHEENVRALERIDWGSAQGTRWATIVIAASNSTPASKATADYVCGASNAATIINQAISQLLSTQSGSSTPLGRIVLLEGTYNVGATPVGSSNLNGRVLHIQGMGGLGRSDTIGGTRVVGTGRTFSFIGSGIGGGSSVMISDLQAVSNSSSLVSATIVGQDIPMYVTRCMVIQTGGGTGVASTNTIGASAATRIVDNYIYCVSGDAGITVNGGPAIDEPCLVSGNYIKMTGSNCIGIQCRNEIATVPSYQIVNNNIVGPGTSTGTGIQIQGNSSEDVLVASNTITSFATGILAGGHQHFIVGNLMQTVAVGYDSATGGQYHGVLSNMVVNCTTVAFRFGSGGTSMLEGTIAFNKIAGSPAATAVSVGSGSTNCGVFYNDWYGSLAYLSDAGTGTRTEGWFLTAAMIPAHATSHEVGGTDPLTGLLNANARVGVRKNSAGSTFLRRRVNLIEGSNVTLTVADDSGSEEVDVTIAAASGGGTVTVKKNGSAVGAQNTLNMIEGTGTTLTVTDTGTQIDITIAASSATSASASNEFNYLYMR